MKKQPRSKDDIEIKWEDLRSTKTRLARVGNDSNGTYSWTGLWLPIELRCVQLSTSTCCSRINPIH